MVLWADLPLTGHAIACPPMARRIEFRTAYGHPAERVMAALTDETFVRERLTQIGGRASELMSFTVDGGAMTAVMRQGIDAEHLPGVVRRVAPNGVTIERTETWHAGTLRGTVDAEVRGFTGRLNATASLGDTPAGSELVIDGEVKVGVPLVGGRIEAVVAEELERLFQAEGKFTNRWLESHQA